MSGRAGDRYALRELSTHEHSTHRIVVPLLIGLSVSLLVAGLSLPIVTVQKHILWKTIENTYSVIGGVQDLAHGGDYLLAAVVFFFSMIFPFVKLAGLWLLWSARLLEQDRQWILRWLGSLGKWSMLDVFAVAILVVLAKLRTLTEVEPRIGIYVFGAAIISSMTTTMYVDRLVHRTRRSRRAPSPAEGRSPMTTMTHTLGVIGLAALLAVGGSGCALVLVGAGAAGGYAISKDSITNHYDLPKDVVYRQSLAVVKTMGQVLVDDPSHGLLRAEIRDVKVTVTVTPVTKRTVKVVVKARNAVMLPAMDVAQDVYQAIHQRLG